jgi:hypothetical protein
MTNFDSDRTTQVWQRVRGEAPPETLSQELLQSLILEELSGAAAYLVLSRQISGRDGMLLRRLFEESHAHAVCLKGICTLIAGKRPLIRGAVPEKTNPEIILRSCYGREMRCLATYEKYTMDREYGPVFTRLAEQKKEHCRLVLELIGRMK